MSKYFNWPTSLKRFVRFDAARAEEVNDALDTLTSGLDTLDVDVDRSIKLPPGSPDQLIPLLSGQRANLLLAFDGSGNISAIAGGGRYRGDWVTATLYVVSDYFRDPVTKNIYSTVVQHTSSVLATDITAGKAQLAIDVQAVEAQRVLAETAATTAATQAGIATTQAAAAVGSASAASGSASASAANAAAALISEQNALASAQNSATSAGASSGSASASAGSATASAASAVLAAASAASISGGPVTSVNGRTGVVTGLVDEAPSDGKTYGRKDAAWVEGGGIANVSYDNRSTLRTTVGTTAIVDGLGLFVFEVGSTEPDDDESCFATAAGRWLLQAVHWDFADAYVQAEIDTAAAKTLHGSANNAISSVVATSSASFTGTVTGAVPGDRVIITPPAELGATGAETGRLSYHAFVSAADTVTIMLTNASAATANTSAAIRAAWPITVIKA